MKCIFVQRDLGAASLLNHRDDERAGLVMKGWHRISLGLIASVGLNLALPAAAYASPLDPKDQKDAYVGDASHPHPAW